MVQSIQRAVQILDTVSEHAEGIRIVDISKKLGLRMTTTYNLVETLCKLSLLKQNLKNKKYQLGSKTLVLGNIYLQNLSIYKTSYPIIENLSYKIKENLYIVLREEDLLSFIIFIESSHSVRPTRSSIDLSNAHATAIGKMFLSSFSESELEQFFNKKSPLESFTKNTITDKKGFIDEIRRIKKNSYAMDQEESELGIKCLAVPILNHDNNLIATLGTSIPTQRFSNDTIEKILPELKNAAHEISTSLGYRSPRQTGKSKLPK